MENLRNCYKSAIKNKSNPDTTIHQHQLPNRSNWNILYNTICKRSFIYLYNEKTFNGGKKKKK